jgi:hypothetical protein
MIWLSYRTAARLLGISNLEVVLLARVAFFPDAKRYAVKLAKDCWAQPKYTESLKRAIICVGGW